MSETETTELKDVKTVDPEKSAKAKEAADLRAQKKARMVEKHLETLKRASTKKGEVQKEFINTVSGLPEAKRTREEWAALVADGTFKQSFVDLLLSDEFDFITEKKVYVYKPKGPSAPKEDLQFGLPIFRKSFGTYNEETKTWTVNNQEMAEVGLRLNTAIDQFLEANKADFDKAAEHKLFFQPFWRNGNNEGKGKSRTDETSATEVVS